MTCPKCDGVGRKASVPHTGLISIETCSCLTDMQRRRRLEAQLKILDKKIEDFEKKQALKAIV